MNGQGWKRTTHSNAASLRRTTAVGSSWHFTDEQAIQCQRMGLVEQPTGLVEPRTGRVEHCPKLGVRPDILLGRFLATSVFAFLAAQLPSMAATVPDNMAQTGIAPLVSTHPEVAPLRPPIQGILSGPIQLPKPELKALISVDEHLNPYELDASNRTALSLKDALKIALVDNLDIGIAHSRQMSSRWQYISSLGKFLPDLNSGYALYGLAGKISLPFATSSSAAGGAPQPGLPSHFNVLSAGFTYNGYQGGQILFGALEQKHNMRAQNAAARATISDTLMEVTRQYNELLLQEALLLVHVRAVDTSNEQLRINTKLAENGLATNLDILQAQTQLSRDRQDLVSQEIARRAAAITLATTLNMPLATDVVLADRTVQKMRLVDNKTDIQQLLAMAADHRPELKQSQELWLAAKRAVGVAAAPLQPSLKLQGAVYGLGSDANNMAALYTLAMNLRWDVHGLGVTDSAQTVSAKWNARQRLLQQNQTLLNVFEQVRKSYIDSLRAERNIAETQNEVSSSQEELRLAKIRFEQGLGSNIDVFTAQRDVTSALVNHARAVADFNITQAQILHDIGLISVDNLTAVRPLVKQ